MPDPRQKQDQERRNRPSSPELSFTGGPASRAQAHLDVAFETLTTRLETVFPSASWALFLNDDTSGELHAARAGGPLVARFAEVRIPSAGGVIAWVYGRAERVVLTHPSQHSQFLPSVDGQLIPPDASAVIMSISSQDCAFGVLLFTYARAGQNLTPLAQALLETLADYAAMAMENSRQLQRAHEQTITDDCTDLFNARHFKTVLEGELERSRRYSFDLCLVFFDLDHFKQVNDTHGHLVGTQLLSELGHWLKQSGRLIDYAFRYGGDEFVVLLPQTSKEGGYHVARRLHRIIGERIWLNDAGLALRITASFGVAAFPADSQRAADLFEAADEAMYLAKRISRNAIAAAGVGIISTD